jgi:hypothetical protein
MVFHEMQRLTMQIATSSRVGWHCRMCRKDYTPSEAQVRHKMHICSPCLRDVQAARRAQKPDVVSDASKVKRAAWHAEYYKNPEVLRRQSEWRKQYRRDEMAYAKDASRQKLRDAVRAGTVVPKPCERCGETRVHGHHDDYSKPLDVRWLCRKHHDEHHKGNKCEKP